MTRFTLFGAVVLAKEDLIVFERLTTKGALAINYALEEQERLSFNFTGTEFLFLGIIRADERIGTFFSRRGVTLQRVREEAEKIVGHGSGMVHPVTRWTPNGTEALIRAEAFADQLGRRDVSPVVLLIGLLRHCLAVEENGGKQPVAHQILSNLGLPDLKELIKEL